MRWRKKRAKQLKIRPFCELCLKGAGQADMRVFRMAEVADHIDPTWRLKPDMRRRFFAGRLQSLCGACHRGKSLSADLTECRDFAKKQLYAIEY